MRTPIAIYAYAGGKSQGADERPPPRVLLSHPFISSAGGDVAFSLTEFLRSATRDPGPTNSPKAEPRSVLAAAAAATGSGSPLARAPVLGPKVAEEFAEVPSAAATAPVSTHCGSANYSANSANSGSSDYSSAATWTMSTPRHNNRWVRPPCLNPNEVLVL